MRALTPAHRHLDGQVSPFTSCYLPIVPSSTTWYATASLYPPSQRAALLPGFATFVQARRYTPPKQVRHPTDRQFASGYSPPRLTTTQLPSATELWLTPAGTFTLQIARTHGRTRNHGWFPPYVTGVMNLPFHPFRFEDLIGLIPGFSDWRITLSGIRPTDGTLCRIIVVIGCFAL